MSTICEGKATRKEAILDYVLCNELALQSITKMVIDENRIQCSLSDHNMIMLEMKLTPSRGNKGKKKELISTNYKRAAALARKEFREALDDCRSPAHEDAMSILKEKTMKCTNRITINEKYGV